MSHRRSLPRTAALALLLATVATPLVDVSPAAAGGNKTTICHRTSSAKNPYRRITVSQSSLTNRHGHAGHTGSVWSPGAAPKWGDIVPDATGGGTNQVAMNFTDAGKAVWSGQTTSPGGAACGRLSARRFFELQQEARATDPSLTDQAIVDDLNAQGANEDRALLAALGGEFTLANMDRWDSVKAVTSPPTEVTETTATLRGTVSLGPTSADLSFVYGTRADLATGTTTQAATPGSGSGDVTATARLAGLVSGTTYYFKIVATTDPGQDTEGTVEGQIESFVARSTSSTAPPTDPTPEGPAPVDPPADPTPKDPTPEEPAQPTDPTPKDPTPEEPAQPTDPTPEEPAQPRPHEPSQPGPQEPAQPRPHEPAPPAPTLPAAPVPVPPVQRVSGAERTETAAQLAAQLYPDPRTARVVVLARNDIYADGMTGSPLAGTLDGPVLLTDPDRLPVATAAAIRRVLAQDGKVVLLGGVDAITPAVAREVTALGYPSQRIGGVDRYATAALIADRIGSTTSIGSVYLATGTNFPDALSAASAAEVTRGVVLLTRGSVMPPVTDFWLREHIDRPSVAVGGAAAAASPRSERIVGSDRYTTAAQVAARVLPKADGVVMVTGADFPDGLAGASYAARNAWPMLLVDPRATALTSGQEEYLGSLRGGVKELVAIGGPAALPERATALVTRRLTAP